MRILLTGASGFIGRAVTRVLEMRGHRLLLLSRRLAPTSAAVVHLGDVTDQDSLLDASRTFRPEVTIHLAAAGVAAAKREWNLMFSTNVVGTLNLLDAVSRFGCRRFVYVGSSVSYGSREGFITEDCPLLPLDGYGATKAAGEILSRTRAIERGAEWIGLRVFSCYGPGQGELGFIGGLISEFSKHGSAKMTKGTQIRDFVYVDDVAEAIALSAEQEDVTFAPVFNVGSGIGTALATVGSLVRDRYPDASLFLGGIAFRTHEIWEQVASIERIRQSLGWSPSTQLEVGINRTVGWFAERAGARS